MDIPPRSRSARAKTEEREPTAIRVLALKPHDTFIASGGGSRPKPANAALLTSCFSVAYAGYQALATQSPVVRNQRGASTCYLLIVSRIAALAFPAITITPTKDSNMTTPNSEINLPTNWTGDLATCDLRSLDALQNEEALEATLVVDHPAALKLHGAKVGLMRDAHGAWHTWCIEGQCLPHRAWEWEDCGDTGAPSEQHPVLDIVFLLRLAAESTRVQAKDAASEDESPEVFLLLAQRMDDAAEHLEMAFKRANGRG